MNSVSEILFLFPNRRKRIEFVRIMGEYSWSIIESNYTVSSEYFRIRCVLDNEDIENRCQGLTYHAIVCPKNYSIPSSLLTRIRPHIGREEEIKRFLTNLIDHDKIVEVLGYNLDYVTMDVCGMLTTNYDDKQESVMKTVKKFNLQEALDGKPFVTESGNIGYILKDLSTLKLAKTNLNYPLAAFVNGNAVIRYTLDGTPSCGFLTQDNLTIKGMYVEPAQFSAWDVIDKKWKYVAADEDWDGGGYNVHLYTEKPRWCRIQKAWHIDYGSDGEHVCIAVLKKGLFTYDSPEHSLTERPSK